MPVCGPTSPILIVAVISVDTYALLMSEPEPRLTTEHARTVAAARQLRSTMRRDTVLAYRGDGDFLAA